MLQKQKTIFRFVPEKRASQFRKETSNFYFQLCENNNKSYLPNEMDLLGCMSDTMDRLCSLEIFEDEYHYKTLDEESALFEDFQDESGGNLELFIHDFIVVLQEQNYSFHIDTQGMYHNLPALEVW